MERIAAATPRQLARTAGGLYLINILGGFFAIGLVPGLLFVAGDASATAHNIQANELLYRLGIVAHIAINVTSVFLAVIFYDLFKVVNRRLALLVVFFTLVGTAVESANLLNQFTPLVALRDGSYASAFAAQQLQAQAYLPMALMGNGYDVDSVFFAIYGIAIGYLVFKSTFLPRIIGVLLVIGASCYMAYGLADIISPAFAAHLVPYIQLPSLLGEGSFCLWLLIVGLNVERWTQHATAATSRLEWAR